MKIETLRSFQAVLSSGTFAAASQALNLTPSAVSLQMKQLEEFFGRVLFDRSSRMAMPTPFALEAAPVLAQAIALLEGLRSPRPLSATGLLRLGVIANIEKSALPTTLRILQAEHPGLTIRLSQDVSAALINAVKSGRIDAALAVRPQAGGSRRLHWVNLVREDFVLLAPANLPRAKPAAMLQQLPWIRYSTSLTGGRIAATYVRQVCPSARAGMEIVSTDAVVAMVAEGLGVSVVPRPRQALIRSYPVQVIELGPQAPWRQIALLSRRPQAEDRRLLALEDTLRRAYAALAPGR
ncbi:LysR family transcriptional regulator [Verticiella sediminum]|uniref:LysR family transcriptional regulator n=1 Tax=Verticiella sediminum TaxID=1247510 RepID=A0A556AE87_9BURK|nr:LysR family transcriptional regulator [Verticiella sediminum]TSH91201.1 LysR family transcriptional regulator [Verticiella sediminum]